MNGNGHLPHLILEYKALPQTSEAWARMRAAMKGVKGFIPPPALGVAAIAENQDKEIVAGAVLQMVPYLGPFWIRPDYRAKVDYAALKQIIDGQFGKIGGSPLIIQGYVAMTDDQALVRMGEQNGMRVLDCVTLYNEVDAQNGLPQER